MRGILRQSRWVQRFGNYLATKRRDHGTKRFLITGKENQKVRCDGKRRTANSKREARDASLAVVRRVWQRLDLSGEGRKDQRSEQVHLRHSGVGIGCSIDSLCIWLFAVCIYDEVQRGIARIGRINCPDGEIVPALHASANTNVNEMIDDTIEAQPFVR